MYKKHTIEEVNKLFKERGCTLISNKYEGNRYKLEYIAQCGHKHKISIDNFIKGKGNLCKKCRYKRIGAKKKNSYEDIKKVFEENNCKLISKTYINNNEKLKYIAQCGHTNEVSYGKFQSGVGRVCNKCSKSIVYKYDYVREVFENKGCYLLEEEYINCKTPMEYIALCGHESYITLDCFMNSTSATKKCKDCHKIKYHEITEERDMKAMKLWVKNIYERDNYECKKCGQHGGKLNAHHINGYNTDKENRLNIDNGITLCEQCHIDFHRKYGYGLNTKEQFNKWIDGNTEIRA